MTVRTDISFNMEVSPRIITVAIPSTDLSVQDLHDTVTHFEDSPEGGQYPKLIQSAGKEDLGGGVLVGITSTLLNAQVYFPPRSTTLNTPNACTTADPNGQVLISSTSTFQSDGVARGDVVFNGSTGGMATVLSVESETQLTHIQLSGGFRNDWQIGDGIALYNNPQCNISGGNLVAVDDNGAQISPVLNSPLAQVIRTASSSATLQEQDIIQYASFNGGVWFDETSPYSGTEFPVGTPQAPVNNVYDAYGIAIERGLTIGYVVSDLTMPIDVPLTNFTFIGQGKDRTLITIPEAANVFDCIFMDAEITGYLDGKNTFKDCKIANLAYVEGFIESCVLFSGTISLLGTGTAHFLDCYSGVPGVGTPTIDFGGSGQALAMRNYNGGIKLQNKTGTEAVSIDLSSGQIIIDDTVTNGDIVLRGVGKWTNQNTYVGGANILEELIEASLLHDLHAANFNKRVWDKIGNTVTIYDTDGVTPIHVFDVNSDLSSITPQ